MRLYLAAPLFSQVQRTWNRSFAQALESLDAGTAVRLTIVGVVAFALSHALGLVIGAWPSVLLVSAITAWLCWRWSDARWLGRTPATVWDRRG